MVDNDHSADPGSRARDIFTQALSHTGLEVRKRFVVEACGGDLKLRALVEELLDVHEEAKGFLEPARANESEASGETAGTRIGQYELLELIGEGGFGAVWAAEQIKPVRRQVALKIIKLGMDTRQVVARFEAERQALALMDHPNVAKVYDAGATDSGRPYFVMELVRGEKITAYCDRRRLGLNQRLELVIQVCHAIQHAHQKGLIHRDIKPSNILVTEHDGRPVPKVIDFGIAKATGVQLTDKTVYTALTQFIGTPTYMSPEQTKLSREDIDTRSDIYSLGVLLYEILTGLTPFDEEALLQEGLEGIRRSIRETEPPRPSHRLKTSALDALQGLALARCSEPVKLIRELRSDLDCIVMKCLEKERSRRYDTVNGLAQDLERHLNQEPVLARPPSTLYRLQKTLQRHRLGFAAAAAVFLALALAAGIFLDAARRERATSLQLQHDLARQYLRQGQSLAENGDVARGLHWMVRSLEQTPAGSDALKQTIEENLVAWSQQWVEPEQVMFEKAYVHSAALSPDGQYAASSSRSGTLTLWSVKDAAVVFERQDFKSPISHLAFGPKGRRLLAGSRNGMVRLYAIPSGDPIGEPMRHNHNITSMAFSHDGQSVATAAGNGEFRVWSGTDAQPVISMLRVERWLTGIAFSPDDQFLLTGSYQDLEDKEGPKIWSIASEKPILPPLDIQVPIWKNRGFQPAG